MSPTNGGVLLVVVLAGMSTVQQPPTLTQPTLIVQTGHVGRINAAAFSSDSRLIATGDHRGSILVWDVESGRQLGSLAGHDAGVVALAFSPDGRWLASSSGFADTYDVRVWDLSTGRERHRLGGHEDRVLNLVFSPDSRFLATAGDRVRIWDVATGAGRPLASPARLSHRAFVAYNPDGRTLAIRDEGQVSVVSVAAGTVVRRLPVSGTLVRLAVVYSRDGKRLATVDNRRLKIWDSATAKPALDTRLDYQFGADVASFSANGREIAVMIDSQFTVRNAASGAALRRLSQPSGSVSILSPDWRHYTDQSGDQRLLNVNSTPAGQPSLVLSGTRVASAGAVAFSSDGSVLATKAGKRFWIWPLGGGQPRVFDGHDGEWGEIQINLLAFLPNSRSFISADWTGRIVQRRLDSGTIERSIEIPAKGSTRGHAMTADGRWLVSAGQHAVSLMQLPEWKIRRVWDSEHRDVAISASGRYVASASFTTNPNDQRPPWVDLWDAQSDASRTLTGHTEWTNRVAFGGGDRWLASADFTGTIKIWDVQSGRQLKTLTLPGSRPAWSLTFSPDGRILAAGGPDNSISLLDLQSGSLIRQLHGHLDSVSQLRFSPDGRILASGSQDGSTRLWNPANGRELVKLLVMDQQNEWLAVATDGRFDGSDKGRDAMVGWRVGSTVYRADRFAAAFFKPGLLASLLRER